MKSSIKGLTSLPLMLIFAAAGFIVLVASVILMTVESLISPILSQTPSSKTGTGKKVLLKLNYPSSEPQICSRT